MVLILGQEVRNGEKSGRVREKVGLKLDLAGQGAASRRRRQRARAWVGAWGGGGGGGAGSGSSSAGPMPAESSEHRGGQAATGCDEAAALGLGAAAVGTRVRGPLAGPAAWHSSRG